MFLEQGKGVSCCNGDYNQYVVKEILSYKSDPERRRDMEFEVLFEDGSVVFLPYSKDLSDTVQFESYVRKEKPLMPLLYTGEAWKRVLKQSYVDIVGVELGDKCFVDLCAWDSDYFEFLLLPQGRYVVLCEYVRWEGGKRMKVIVYCHVFRTEFWWSSFSVYAYGMDFSLMHDMVLVDEALCQQYPAIDPN